MGYTGSITLNGNQMFAEWKSDGTFYCMNYPVAYLKTKPCELTSNAIKKALGQIHHGVTGYGSIAYDLGCFANIIYSLTGLIDGYNSEKNWEEDGTCNLVIKMQYHDAYGNFEDINFYHSDEVSDVPTVEQCEKISISKEQLEDIRFKRVAGVKVIDIFSAFYKLNNGRKRYEAVVEDLMNLTTRAELFEIIKKLNEGYAEAIALYNKRYSIAIELTRVLEPLMPKIANGGKFYVQYSYNALQVFNDENNWTIPCDDFFMLSELFANNGIESCGASITITEKSELRAFIGSFDNMKDDECSTYFESLIRGIYNNLGEDEAFCLSVGGGF